MQVPESPQQRIDNAYNRICYHIAHVASLRNLDKSNKSNKRLGLRLQGFKGS